MTTLTNTTTACVICAIFNAENARIIEHTCPSTTVDESKRFIAELSAELCKREFPRLIAEHERLLEREREVFGYFEAYEANH